ncbi:MAG: hypothetical protein ACLT4C_07590 [Butyricicoccus sp.]
MQNSSRERWRSRAGRVIARNDRETERLRNELRGSEQFAAEQISREAVIQANIRNCEENIERTRQESAHRAEQVQSMDAQLAERRERISVLNEQEKAQSAELDALRKQSAEQEQQRTQAEQALRQAEQAQRRQERTLHGSNSTEQPPKAVWRA